MTIKEVGHIYTALEHNGPTEQPHYTSEAYQTGANIEGGFEVRDKPAEPVHEVIRMNPFGDVDLSDTEPHYMKNHAGEPTDESSRPVRVVCEEPHYMNPERGREAKAEAVAQAVKAAIMRGELDPSIFE